MTFGPASSRRWEARLNSEYLFRDSTTRADAVVDLVVLLLDRPVKRRRARRLRSAGLRDGLGCPFGGQCILSRLKASLKLSLLDPSNPTSNRWL
jgi:hypothetical protein